MLITLAWEQAGVCGLDDGITITMTAAWRVSADPASPAKEQAVARAVRYAENWQAFTRWTVFVDGEPVSWKKGTEAMSLAA